MLTKAPGSWLLEIVQRDVLAVLAGLRLIAEVVIVVDHGAFDLAGIDRLHGGAVAPVGGDVLLHRLQPGGRRRLALELRAAALTMAWKSAPDGEAAQRPFQLGSARSSSDFGNWSAVSLVLS